MKIDTGIKFRGDMEEADLFITLFDKRLLGRCVFMSELVYLHSC